MSARIIPPELEPLVSAWRAGARTVSQLADAIGMSRAGAHGRLLRARRLGIIPPAPRRGRDLRLPSAGPSRLARISPSAFHRGVWRFLTAGVPAEVIHRGVVIGTFTPAGTPAPAITPSDLGRLRVAPYELSPDLRVDVLRALSDVAAALVEIEELRGVRPGNHRRLTEFHRRQAAYLLALGRDADHTEPHQTAQGDPDDAVQ
jgi:hypothetical protein